MLYKTAMFVAHIVEFVSIGIIAWGVILALFRIAVLGFKKYRTDMDLTYSWLRMRRMFGETLLLGLQFLVAADVVLTVANPKMDLMLVLGGIVFIRIALSLSLSKEIEELAHRDRKQGNDD